MAWTEEDKAKLIEAYKAAGPTAENSTEIIKELAEQFEQSPNGVRMILVQAKVYVKKEDTGSGTSKTSTKTEGAKRVSKEDSIAALKAAIEAKGAEVDEDILSKLTGKAAVYFLGVLKA